MRCHKIFATSRMNKIIEQRVNTKKEMYDVLKELGVVHVVVEEGVEYDSAPLNWIIEDVQSDKFLLKERIPIQTNFKKLENASLGIYEYKNSQLHQPNAMIDVNVPLMGGRIAVRLDDLIDF